MEDEGPAMPAGNGRDDASEFRSLPLRDES